MQKLTSYDKKYLLKLARNSIEYYLKNKKYLEQEEELNEVLKLPLATFITLKKEGNLRGCMGHLEPIQELHKDVVENSVAAASFDSRFPEVTIDELDDIEIEISILTPKKPIHFSKKEELFEKLNRGPGVVLSKNGYSATFLPQVWETLPDTKEFLEELSLKAGLDKNGWINANFETYNVIKFSELSN